MIKMFRALWSGILPAAFTVVLATGALSACSSWPFHSKLPSSPSPTSSACTSAAADALTVPPLQPDCGRVYFFRMGSHMPDALIRPEIRMDGKVVGVARPGSYFMVDLPTGVYSAAATRDMDRSLNVFVTAGQTSYVQVEVRFPVLTGRVSLSETAPRMGVNMVSGLDYESESGN